MNDLVPLKNLARNELEVSVLRSADADRASPDAMKRVAASLGVSVTLMALSSTASAASVVGIGAVGLVKSLLVGVGAGMLVSGALYSASVVTAPAPVTSPALNPLSEVSRPERDTARPASPVLEQAEANATPAPPTARASRASEVLPLPGAPSPAPTSSVAEEVAVLDRARGHLAAGRADEALRALDSYALRWPDGVMTLEASVVRVEAELARGNRANAERHARALTATHPNTGHARKVTSLLERANVK